MTTWCLAHPWMTFFIALAVSYNGLVRIVVRKDQDD